MNRPKPTVPQARVSIRPLVEQMKQDGMSFVEIGERLNMAPRDVAAPDPTVNLWKADRIAVHLFGVHPAYLFGTDEWLAASRQREKQREVLRARRRAQRAEHRSGRMVLV